MSDEVIPTTVLAGHEPSLLPAGKQWKLVWNDEFDGTELDRSKWDYRVNFWGKRFPAFADNEGAVLDGKGNLELHLLKHGDQYCCPQLQTGSLTFDNVEKEVPNPWGQASIWPFSPIKKPGFMHRYGFYECRCKMQRSTGWWSAFWLQSPTIGATYNPAFSGVESDIMECFDPQARAATSGNIYGGYGQDYHNAARVNYNFEETPDGFHRFALDWSPAGYVFYCDGKVVSRQSPEEGPVSRVEQFILLTTEPKGYRNKDPKPRKELLETVLPDCFTVDYVRVFDEI